MENNSSIDIQRILAITWKDDSSKSKSIDEIARYWSLNLQWLNPEEALQAANNFLKNGWFDESEGGYIPSLDIQGIIAPLGWWPKTSIFLGRHKKENRNLEIPEIKNDAVNDEKLGDDSKIIILEEKIVKRIIRYVASKSGISREEVERRAKRKLEALGHISHRMSVILVAKEQGLDVADLLSID